MGHVLRRGLAVLAVGLALAPLSAYAEDGNQAAINAAKARQAWLQNMTPLQEGVALGQAEIANAYAIAKLLSWDAHAQTYIPNSMKQYEMFCSMAIQHVQSQVANANAMASTRPWDLHAQAELANANATMSALWAMIGDSYPGNPYYAAPYSADDQALVADDQATSDDLVASDEGGDTLVADDAVDVPQ